MPPRNEPPSCVTQRRTQPGRASPHVLVVTDVGLVLLDERLTCKKLKRVREIFVRCIKVIVDGRCKLEDAEDSLQLLANRSARRHAAA